MQLDHVTLRTRNLARTRDFFIEVFGLVESTRPEAIRRIPGHWLCTGGEPIIHLIGSRGLGAGSGPEAWDHVGFRLTGYREFRARIEQLGIRYSTMDLPELNERRLIFHAPCGQLIETVFREDAQLSGDKS
ncbi:glyoxalase [Leisingera thetidis]|uniref:glyoxalase n=1 Tax=Leisingera thetidis TaxID=2930199 RepID=UPI0021F770B8|nr:glyoxalase [Leisingera thetidis]